MGDDMAHVEERLSALPGEWCPHIKNDHPPICQQDGVKSCLKCPEYLDGKTDIPLSEELMTENMKMLLILRDKRDSWYAEVDAGYRKVHSYDDPIANYERKVRQEQGR